MVTKWGYTAWQVFLLAEIRDHGRIWWAYFLSMPGTAKVSSEFSLSPAAAKLRLLKKLRCTLRYEKNAWASGAVMVAGVDEVGRGSLFGPVVAAAVILDRGYRLRGLRDSKLLLPERRERLAPRIREHAVAWAVAAVDAARIDQINIYQASRLAMREAARSRSSFDRRRAAGLRTAAAGDRSRRCALRVDCGGFDSGQGRARSHDV
jgi:hypothetical protein